MQENGRDTDDKQKVKRYVYNPDTHDFSITYDVNHNQEPIEFVIPAREMVAFSEPLLQHVTKHLANKILIKRGVSAGTWDEEYKKVMNEILIDL